MRVKVYKVFEDGVTEGRKPMKMIFFWPGHFGPDGGELLGAKALLSLSGLLLRETSKWLWTQSGGGGFCGGEEECSNV